MTTSSIKVVSAVGALSSLIIAATYKLMIDINSTTRGEITEMKTEMRQGFQTLSEKLNKLGDKFDLQNQRVAKLDGKLEEHNRRIQG